MGATLERMGGEEGIVPKRSEWFRSRVIIGTTQARRVTDKQEDFQYLLLDSPRQ